MDEIKTIGDMSENCHNHITAKGKVIYWKTAFKAFVTITNTSNFKKEWYWQFVV